MNLDQTNHLKINPSYTETKNIKIILLFLFSIFFSFSTISQNIGINATGAEPDASALLDLSSTDKGFLITRADTIDIVSPAFGLMTLSPEDSCLYMQNGKTKGKTWISIGGVGAHCSEKIASEFPCGGTIIPIVDVTSVTGKVWMDRNLGASQVATNSKDAAAYGDLYQWGRCSDGHEKRTSGTISTQATSDIPGHGDFIVGSSDWRNPSSTDLWQGKAGINNPCPKGYRIPSMAEATAELNSWSTYDAAGAFASPLKLTLGGHRNFSTGALSKEGNTGYYSTSATNGNGLFFNETTSPFLPLLKANGYSVRCIKD